MRQALRRGAPVAAAALAAPLAVAACFSYPETRDRLDDDIVLTRFDPDAVFSSYATFSIRADVPLLDGSEEPSLLDAAASATLIEAVARNMVSRGYVRVDPSAAADLGVEIAITTEVNARQVCYPYGYRRSYYWGYPGYSYYAPWGCSTSVWTSGTVFIDILDLRAAAAARPPAVDPDAGVPDAGTLENGLTRPLNAIWFGATYRVLSTTAPANVARAVAGIDQAFVQSPYLRAAGTP